MSILVNEDTKVLIQGITGAYGRNQSAAMKEYGTNIVVGVAPGRAGTETFGVPVYNTVKQAGEYHDFDASIIYVPPPFTKDAVLEAVENGVELIVIATEGVPIHDTLYFRHIAEKYGTWIVGPNSIGMISPGKTLLGSLAPSFTFPGNVGLISRSGTMAIEFVQILGDCGIGLSTGIGIGGDKVIGKNPIDYLKLFEDDPDTRAVVMLGEIGGSKELEAADYIKEMSTKVFSFIVGISAPKGKRMGHIGAIASAENEGAEYKKNVLKAAGSYVADTPWELGESLKYYLMEGIQGD
ncbi:succinate--CoA ligase subunit alpha [Metallumcola ferriviriculae]|uniref:Succinate--CoA ligase subunit alpha n=1 Tax=Metallumcola ferriviriculae TaxID=3039180 RepID=A0AAU0UQ69_9FIRM|nr:succinate--CoA ligase subunit alpha [Desulfitibacteraceae bacterium MK1]